MNYLPILHVPTYTYIYAKAPEAKRPWLYSKVQHPSSHWLRSPVLDRKAERRGGHGSEKRQQVDLGQIRYETGGRGQILRGGEELRKVQYLPRACGRLVIYAMHIAYNVLASKVSLFTPYPCEGTQARSRPPTGSGRLSHSIFTHIPWTADYIE